LSIAARMFLRVLAASPSGQSCRIILRRYASAPRAGCGWWSRGPGRWGEMRRQQAMTLLLLCPAVCLCR
jgi:hypothetical protein